MEQINLARDLGYGLNGADAAAYLINEGARSLQSISSGVPKAVRPKAATEIGPKVRRRVRRESPDRCESEALATEGCQG